MIKSAYIHIPFCKQICSYCDFCKNFYDDNICFNYIDALYSEIKDNYKNETLDTLYIGGGTPSSLSIKNQKKLFNVLKNFKLSKKYEFTYECNYEDITEELLILLKENRVNRLSIGIQTFNENYQAFLQRKINKKDIIDKINLSKKYFDNINIDLMYALNNESINDLKRDLEVIKKININHISTYALIIENNTKLKIDNVKEVSDDVQSKMYYFIKDYLESIGYEHYEISNYAKKGFKSKHNLTYWNNDNYYGFGIGASGFINNYRYTNTKSILNYINGKKVNYEETLDKNSLMKDEIMLNLRKINGINKTTFYNKYNCKLEDVFDYSNLVKMGYLIENDNIKINSKYLFVSNEIIIKLLDSFKLD